MEDNKVEDDSYQPIEVEKTYPSRTRKIGEVTCYFKSWYRKGKYPYWSIGPSTSFMGGFILFAIAICCFFFWTINATSLNWYVATPLYFMIAWNLHSF